MYITYRRRASEREREREREHIFDICREQAKQMAINSGVANQRKSIGMFVRQKRHPPAPIQSWLSGITCSKCQHRIYEPHGNAMSKGQGWPPQTNSRSASLWEHRSATSFQRRTCPRDRSLENADWDWSCWILLKLFFHLPPRKLPASSCGGTSPNTSNYQHQGLHHPHPASGSYCFLLQDWLNSRFLGTSQAGHPHLGSGAGVTTTLHEPACLVTFFLRCV